MGQHAGLNYTDSVNLEGRVGLLLVAPSTSKCWRTPGLAVEPLLDPLTSPSVLCVCTLLPSSTVHSAHSIIINPQIQRLILGIFITASVCFFIGLGRQ